MTAVLSSYICGSWQRPSGDSDAVRDAATVGRAIVLAQRVLAADEKAAATAAVVIVDATAQPILSIQPPGVAPLVANAARRKAAAAAAFGAPTHTLADMFNADPLLAGAFTGSDEVLVLPCGLPLSGPNGAAGAVGIAGGHYSSDQRIR